MDKFIRELESEDIHLRDKWQFELKSELFPLPNSQKNNYTQEFFIFIPNSLGINPETYSKQDFFRDQTNFIRYKTPVFNFSELNNKSNTRSPLFRIYKLLDSTNTEKNMKEVEYELKLLGNIVRSSIRLSMLSMTKIVQNKDLSENLEQLRRKINLLQKELSEFHESFKKLEGQIKSKWFDNSESLIHHYFYVDEFISNSIYYYSIEFLKFLRKRQDIDLTDIDENICKMIILEFQNVKFLFPNMEDFVNGDERKEFILYRAGLLNKFVLDALLLNTNRKSPDSKIKHFIGSFAAGIAMLFYFVLFLWLWQGQLFLRNSEVVILTTVVLYILKDRIKEGLKTISYDFAFKWFPDFKTEIRSPDEGKHLGTLKETFFFLDRNKVDIEIMEARNKKYHDTIEDFQRPESILYHKKSITIEDRDDLVARRHVINLTFRFNIFKFLIKADDSYQEYMNLDEITHKIKCFDLPKVYHINIIMRSSFLKNGNERVTELNKFRLIVDKEGIKRVEHVN